MRKHFFLTLSIVFWLLMMIGFSDNWLFDTAQESNSQPKFIIHAIFAFSWFSLLVIQSGLIRKHQVKTHMKLGVIGAVVYLLLSLTIWNLYFENYLFRDDLMRLAKPLELLSLLLVILGFANRKKHPQKHKEYILFGSFCLIGPALDRTVDHLFGAELATWPMLITYLLIFSTFIWYKKKITWYMLLWILFWMFSLYPFLVHMWSK